jgi:hypothetical protein
MAEIVSFPIARHTAVERIARMIMAEARSPKERDDLIDARCEAMIDKAERNGVPADLACERGTQLYAALAEWCETLEWQAKQGRDDVAQFAEWARHHNTLRGVGSISNFEMVVGRARIKGPRLRAE